VTHIYATDKGGNVVSLQLDPIEVLNPEIAPLASSDYHVSDAMLLNVKAQTTVNALLAQLENGDLEVLDSYGYVLNGNAVVGTGAQVNLYQDGEIVDTVIVTVLGDLDGSGTIDSSDYLRLKAAVMSKFALTDAQRAAADVDGSGKVNSVDYQKIRDYFLGISDLYE
jgi:hypothetical protein